MSQKTFSKKAKELLKEVKDIAASGALGTDRLRYLKKKKKKEEVVDPDETVGGKRIKKQGPEIKVSNTQADLPKRPKGLGAALRGGGRAFNKGGKV